MCAVIFGFMWMTQPTQEQIAEQRRQRDSIAAVQAAEQQVSGGMVDTLSLAEKERLRTLLTTMSADTAGAKGIDHEGVRVSLAGNKLTGSVDVDGTALSIDEVLADTASDPALHNRAVAALKNSMLFYEQNGNFAANLTGSEQLVTLENDSMKVQISTKGGVIAQATLKGYKAFNEPQVNVFKDGDNDYSFTLSNNTQRFETRNYFFTPEEETDSSVVMRLSLGGGATWGLRYTLVRGSYIVRMDIVQEGMEQVIPMNINSVGFDWHQRISRHEEGKMFEERNSGIYYKYLGSGSVDYTSENSDDEKEIKDKLKWIAAKNQFFSTVLIADSLFNGAKLNSRVFEKGTADYQKYLKDMTVHSELPYSSTDAVAGSFMFYIGPNRYKILRDYDKFSPKEDLKLTRLIPLGWKLFRWINTGVIIPVFDWLGTFISNYGIIILVLTILIKLVLSPLTYKSYISQAKMRILAPDIKAINEKYPAQEDALKRQQKTMELYRLAGASPMGGCLPMLLQMPILIAMFTFFPSCIELRGEAFLWAKDLSAPDKIVEWTGQIPFITNYFGNHISLFCLLMTITNIIYTYITMKSQNQSASMPGMKWMMYLMPIFFLVFFNNYASGLSYYYFISLLITILQTYSCRFFVKEDKVRATIAANSAKPKKKSGFMKRLEEAQRQQQEALKRQQQQQKRGGKGGNGSRRR